MTVQLIDNILSTDENLKLIDKLIYHQWYLTRCTDYKSLLEPLLIGRSGGFSVETLLNGKTTSSPLNEEAFTRPPFRHTHS